MVPHRWGIEEYHIFVDDVDPGWRATPAAQLIDDRPVDEEPVCKYPLDEEEPVEGTRNPTALPPPSSSPPKRATRVPAGPVGVDRGAMCNKPTCPVVGPTPEDEYKEDPGESTGGSGQPDRPRYKTPQMTRAKGRTAKTKSYPTVP
ncbi:hypothetical protein VMCG_02827 [Cytospora schulzeri]|uniref:Uncharacterized protein n=1 Tax=Cytospora schulzeri TaxID=448051 RepID=A0A423WZF9_9PEZI|nr:hypothetical protein VMCG_02827 [Valsa malicola]